MKRTTLLTGLAGLLGLIVLASWWWGRPPATSPWSEAETGILRSLWIGSLPGLPADPSNAVADDPRAAALGHRLFFDPRLSGNGAIACATCHQPERRFTDGRDKGHAIGEAHRNTRSVVGAAYSPWLYWDGRRDSLWSQALTPLEDAAEHGGTRSQLVRLLAEDAAYRDDYAEIFGPLPDLADRGHFPDAASPLGDERQRDAWRSMSPAAQRQVNVVFSNLGKAIAAYERLLLPGPSRFDRYVEAVLDGDAAAQKREFSADEVAGLRLFIGKGQCTQCHNGPLLTNNEFHNTGILTHPGDLPDRGRINGVREVRADPFNCLGEFSDDPSHRCAELEFARSGKELLGAFRTPSLRNLGATAPFMHQGQLATLEAVLDHYNRAPLAMIGHNEAKPLGLGRRELGQLRAFLETLTAPPAAATEWLRPPAGAR